MKQYNFKFYYINQKYINYIRQFDDKVPTKNRPYLGIVFKNKDYIYLAPLYSAREKHKNYYMNNTFFRIYDYYNNYIGLIRFSNMIPVPKFYLKQINYDFSNKLYQEYFYISKHQSQILKKAKYTYNKYNDFDNLCVDFKRIEKICKNY
ncbi:MAG: hypothetical protein HFJ35_04060 [Clostridia bacterium]|nr:hypothetical protein [Clostridia bacterium]